MASYSGLRSSVLLRLSRRCVASCGRMPSMFCINPIRHGFDLGWHPTANIVCCGCVAGWIGWGGHESTRRKPVVEARVRRRTRPGYPRSSPVLAWRRAWASSLAGVSTRSVAGDRWVSGALRLFGAGGPRHGDLVRSGGVRGQTLPPWRDRRRPCVVRGPSSPAQARRWGLPPEQRFIGISRCYSPWYGTHFRVSGPRETVTGFTPS